MYQSNYSRSTMNFQMDNGQQTSVASKSLKRYQYNIPESSHMRENRCVPPLMQVKICVHKIKNKI